MEKLHASGSFGLERNGWARTELVVFALSNCFSFLGKVHICIAWGSPMFWSAGYDIMGVRIAMGCDGHGKMDGG